MMLIKASLFDVKICLPETESSSVCTIEFKYEESALASSAVISALLLSDCGESIKTVNWFHHYQNDHCQVKFLLCVTRAVISGFSLKS